MNNQELTHEQDRIIHCMLGRCPNCGELVPDHRYKKEVLGFATHILRRSKRSVTMECSECGLRFTVTYYSLLQALQKMAKLEPQGQFYEKAAETITALAPPEHRGRQKQQGDRE